MALPQLKLAGSSENEIATDAEYSPGLIGLTRPADEGGGYYVYGVASSGDISATAFLSVTDMNGDTTLATTEMSYEPTNPDNGQPQKGIWSYVMPSTATPTGTGPWSVVVTIHGPLGLGDTLFKTFTYEGIEDNTPPSSLTLAIATDSFNYCRYDPRVNTVNAHVSWTGAAGTETLTCTLVRMDGWGVVATQTYAIVVTGSGWYDFAFPLESCFDTQPIPVYRAHAGWYTCVVTSGEVTATTPEFTVTTVSVQEMRNDLCKGLPLYTTETVSVIYQPQVVTGVTVTEVYPETFHGPYLLSYNATGQTLTWGSAVTDSPTGTPVPVGTVPWGSTVLLMDSGAGDWIKVQVKPNLLPSSSVSETLVVDRKEMSDLEICQEIFSAENWIGTKISVAVEPRRGATPLVQATNPGTFYDYTCMPVHWSKNQSPYQFINLKFPHNYAIQLHTLQGAFNDTIVVTVTSDWWDLTTRNGFLSLVPRQGAALQWVFYGGFFFNLLIAYQSVPDFWHYDMDFGFQDLRDKRSIVRDAIARRAAVEILTRAAVQAKPGYASENIARDGVASSLAYAHGPGGIYSETIRHYQDFLDEQVGKHKITQSLVGIQFITL